MEMGRQTVVSLFSGCGGMDLGFIRAGFVTAWANDLAPAACETYRANIGPHITPGDIREIPSGDIPDSDVVIGGFPCQGFSIVGTRRLNDERNFLYRAMKRVIQDKRPKYFVAENVRGLLNMAGGAVVSAMLDEFRSLGYEVSYRLLDARDYGVAQQRERVFIIGNRLGLPNFFPPPTHGPRGRGPKQRSLFEHQTPCLRPHQTLRDVIGDLERLGTLPNHEVDGVWERRKPDYARIMRHIKEGQKLCNVRLGPRSVYTWDIPEVFGAVTEDERQVLLAIAGNRRHKRYGPRDGNPLPIEVLNGLVAVPDLPATLKSLLDKGYIVKRAEAYELKNAFNGIFRRLRWDRPSEAILTVFHSPRYYVHPSQNRPFSVREIARIQGFPDDFVFIGPLKEQYTQIGNAVPPPLAEAVARGVYEALTQGGQRLPASGCWTDGPLPRTRPSSIQSKRQA
jgi:DNA (cytosine-5)-methyltransferase 1